MKYQLDKGAYAPQKAHREDAGYDIRTPRAFAISPAGRYGAGMAVIDTGVHIEIPEGYVGMIKSKSGLNVNSDIITEGVVDSGYTGSIKVKMYNLGRNAKVFKDGDKVTQIVIMPILDLDCELEEVTELDDTSRGNGGFGSTGR